MDFNGRIKIDVLSCYVEWKVEPHSCYNIANKQYNFVLKKYLYVISLYNTKSIYFVKLSRYNNVFEKN